MATAAVTFVYNETFNLPIWIRHYGREFGPENLFVVDRSSDDGSTEGLGAVNVIRIPRTPFDEEKKTRIMTDFHSALTAAYDAVVVTDCDEMLVVDPAYPGTLNDYVAGMEESTVNAIGIDVLHVLTMDFPLEAGAPILSQRSFGKFTSAECKQLIGKAPMRWLPGLHATNRPPRFDTRLFLFHLKWVDYGASIARQRINLATVWSDDALSSRPDTHHRYGVERFMRQGFLRQLALIEQTKCFDFTFEQEIEEIRSRTVQDHQGFFRFPLDISKIVKIPERFQTCL